MATGLRGLALVVVSTLSVAASTDPVAVPTLPPRLLDCSLARIANFDPSKDQKVADFVFEGKHAFKLFLPAIPVRTTEPPASTQPPEPVDPRTRIVADPDRLANAAARRFDRVVDYWPERVELTAPINADAVNLIILSGFDAQRGIVDLFMTKANDAVTYDQAHLYSGKCQVTMGDAATRGAK